MDEELFWCRVDRSGGPDACWPWIPPCTHPSGYGQLGWAGEARTAPSVAFELGTGSRARGAVCHRCNTPPCCNPAHLYDGSQADNMRDREAAGNYARGDAHWARRRPERLVTGERHRNAKLSDRQVAELRAARAAGDRVMDLAARYGISTAHVKRIVAGRARRP